LIRRAWRRFLAARKPSPALEPFEDSAEHNRLRVATTRLDRAARSARDEARRQLRALSAIPKPRVNGG
jgi:hypothetical protein